LLSEEIVIKLGTYINHVSGHWWTDF